MPLIWNIFHFLRIIPKAGSAWTNKIVLTLWQILILTSGVFICCYEFYLSGRHYTISDTITYLLNDILIPLQSLLIIKEFATLAELQRDLEITSLYPKYPFYSLILTILHLASLIIVLYFEIMFSKENTFSIISICYFFATGILYLLNLLLISATRLVIGVAVNNLCTSIEDSLQTVGAEIIEMTFEPLTMKYKEMRTKLSFLLFSIFTVDTIQFTAFAYYIFKYSLYGFIPYLIYFMLQLFYIAYVLDDCYSTLKSSLPIFR